MVKKTFRLKAEKEKKGKRNVFNQCLSVESVRKRKRFLAKSRKRKKHNLNTS